MARRKLPYGEGDWCAVPLQRAGYGLGLIARSDGKGRALGYFFGPRRERPPELSEACGLRPESAVLMCMFGDLGLINGEWRVLGRLPDWRRGDWPVPVFGRVSRIRERVHAWRIHYGDAMLEPLWDEPCPPAEAELLPSDGVYGSGAVGSTLARRLGATASPGRSGAVGSAAAPPLAHADLFDDDVAADARGEFGAALQAGLPPADAAAQVLHGMRKEVEDADDEPVIILALAYLLRERGVREHPAISQARQILASGIGLERWREAGGEVLASRLRLYERIAAQLG